MDDVRGSGLRAEMGHRPARVDIAELRRIRARSLVVFSDDDLVTLEHAVAVFDVIPGAGFAVVRGRRTSAPRRSRTW